MLNIETLQQCQPATSIYSVRSGQQTRPHNVFLILIGPMFAPEKIQDVKLSRVLEVHSIGYLTTMADIMKTISLVEDTALTVFD